MVTNKPELFPTKYKYESYSVLPLLNYSIASIEPLMRLFVSMFLPLSCSGRTYTLSGHIGKVVASHAAVAHSVPSGVALIYTMSCFSKSRCSEASAFRASVLLRLLLDLDTYGNVDLWCVFTLFLKKVADIIAPKLPNQPHLNI